MKNKLWKTKKNRRFLLAVLTGVLMYTFAFISSSLWAYLIPWRLLEIIVWFIAYFGLLAIVLYNWDDMFEKYCS